MGRSDGLAAGKDGNVHMADIRLGLIAMVSHLPALMPVAVGAALAFQIRREPRVAVAWSGDGAMARGDAHEAMNLAGVRKLPVVFIVDNNQYAYSGRRTGSSSPATTSPTARPPMDSRALWWTASTC